MHAYSVLSPGGIASLRIAFLFAIVFGTSEWEPIGYQSQEIWGPTPWEAAAKAGVQMSILAPSREILVTWSSLKREGGKVTSGFPGLWEGLQLAPRCKLN